MAHPLLQILPDAVKTNFIGPLKKDAAVLFGFKQDPRFADPGVQRDEQNLDTLQNAAFSGNTKDAFRGQGSKIAARRPLRGIQIKEDTYVSLRIITDTGLPIFQINAAGKEVPTDPKFLKVNDQIGFSFVNTNFIAQSISEERVEKSQILETFGEPFVFFFGERPRFINVSGFLLNTVDFNWRAEWWENYENNLRGTKLVELRAKVYLTWDDIVVSGYILNAQAQDISTEPYRIPFQFSLFLTNYFNIGIRGSIPTGFTSPIDRLRETALASSTGGPDSIFAKVFNPDNLNKISPQFAKIATQLNQSVSATRNALSIIQSASAKLKRTRRQGSGFFAQATQLLDSPRDIEALVLLRGGIKSPRKFGPLRSNFDEFLGTSLDALDIPTPRFDALTRTSFIQRLISFVPALNNAAQLNKTLLQMTENKIGLQSVTSSDPVRGTRSFGEVFTQSNFGPGAASSPFASP